MEQTLLGIAVVLLLVWLYLRRRARLREAQEALEEAETETSAFHAVSIRFEANACDAAKAMTGRRFLASAAPRLPLPECNVLECRCRFAHHDDRRTGRDRRSPFGARGYSPSGTGSFQKDRRDGAGRRADDTTY